MPQVEKYTGHRVWDQVVTLNAGFMERLRRDNAVIRRNRNLDLPERQFLADSVEKVGHGLLSGKVRV